jgi:hypothetical protein
VQRPWLVLLVASLAWPVAGAAQSAPPSKLEGMWSDPPVTIVARFCASWCTDAGIERLNALLDNPANDSKSVAQLSGEAQTYQLDTYVKARMTPAALASFPLDPADDPGLLKCVPWGLARQIFAPHQLEIRRLGNDRMELHYGEWDARRIVYMDGRKPAAGQSPTRLGHSNGRWEGDVLVVETTAVMADQTIWRARHSDQLRVVERFTRSDDGAMLHLTATIVDPWSLREPLVIKRNWRWAPTSIIAPYEDCKPPIAVKRGVTP